MTFSQTLSKHLEQSSVVDTDKKRYTVIPESTCKWYLWPVHPILRDTPNPEPEYSDQKFDSMPHWTHK